MPRPTTEELRKYAEMHNPKSRVFVETVVIASEDIKDTYADWNAADSVSGWSPQFTGGAKPAGSESNKIQYTTGTGDATTSLPLMSAASVPAVAVRWRINTANEVFQDISAFTARLDPNQDGSSGADVTHWVGQMFRVAEVQDDDWTLEAITQPVRVLAGASVAEVTFNFAGVDSKIGVPPVGETRPITVLHVAALKGDGTAASNVAWIGNTGTQSTTISNNTVTRYNLTAIGGQAGSETLHVKQITAANGLPRFAIKGKTYTQQTIEFTGSNAPTLDATPTGTVEFMLEDEQPGGSAGQGYVRNNGSTTWVAFTDGQTVSDLSGVSSTGPQYEMRYVATPSTDGFTIPTVYRMGVKELTREELDGIARIGNPFYQLNPFSLQASIPEFQVELTRDGVKDYRDFATELFSDHHAGEIEFRVFYGHPDLDRKDWMYADQFRLRNIETGGDSVVIDAVHPLALTRRTIPLGSTSGQDAVVFSGATTTPETVYGDILDTVGLPARYRGVELGSTATTKIAKSINKPRPAKDELDRVAFIEGGAVVPSGGRLKWKRIWSTTGGLVNSPTEHFDDITALSVSPNLHRRIVSYRVPYGFSQELDEGQGGFAGAVLQTSTSALSKLGHAALDPVQDLDEETARWLLSDSTSVGSVYGSAIARRTVAAFKQGAPTIRFRADHPRPWVELGDTVEVKTDRFVGRGLESDRALRGRMSVVGPVIGHDLEGSEFEVWIPEIEAALPDPSDMPITYANPVLRIGSDSLISRGTIGNEQVYQVNLLLHPDKATKSYNVRVQYTQLLPPPSSPNFVDYNYNVDVTTPGLHETHTLQSTTGGTLYLPVKPSTIGPRPFTSPYVTVDPYAKVGGSTGAGVSGTAQSISVRTPDTAEGVGVRGQLSGTTYDFAAYRIVAGSGINIFQSTAGELVISTT